MKANVDIIIGQNAIGKSYMIREMADHDKGRIITNFEDSFFIENASYDPERIRILIKMNV